jgi:hypothetical protein
VVGGGGVRLNLPLYIQIVNFMEHKHVFKFRGTNCILQKYF